MPVLFQLGLLQFTVAPFNTHETTFETGADFAVKDLVGAPKSREFMGPADTKLCFRGTLYPQTLGGLDELAIAEDMATSGDPQMLVRGDGMVLGWYLVESIKEKSGFLDATGIGREIEVEINLVQSTAAASAQSMLSTLLGLFG